MTGERTQGELWRLFWGRERSEAQWRALLEENGFDPVRVEDGLIEARCR